MSKQDRAYSLLDIKAVTEEDGKRVFSGWATTPDVDRVNDTIDPMGAKFANPVVLLHQHNHANPIGTVTFGKATAKGIPFTAEIPVVSEPGMFKDLCDRAWHEIKYRVIRAVSIGFRQLKVAYNKTTGGYDFQEIEIYELSTVSVPANSQALITSVGKSMVDAIKSFDTPAASGDPVDDTPPRAQGKKSVNIALKGSKPMAKTIAEQLAALEASRTEKSARMTEILSKSQEEGRTTDAEEQSEFDELSAEVKSIKDDIERYKLLDANNAATAKAVGAPKTVEEGAQTRAGVLIKAAAPAPGVRLARIARMKALSRIDGYGLVEMTERHYGTRDPDLIGIVKAAVSAVNTTTDAALIGNEGGFADFVEYLRPRTIVGRFGNNGIPGLRRVPFRVPLLTQVSAAVGYWVAEGAAKPLTKGGWDRRELAPLKAANIAVATMEILRDSSPSAELLLRDDLAAAITAAIDVAFIDPTNAGTAGAKPASITNGATARASTGNDAAAIRADVQAAMGGFIADNNDLLAGVWIMSATTALALSMMRTALDQQEFNGVTMNGGTFMGLPVIVSQYVGNYVVLANASDIYLADDGGVSVDMSTEASLQMMDNPTVNSITPTATDLVSMFQTNSVAFRAERTINWLRRRASGVQVITGVAWGQPDAS